MTREEEDLLETEYLFEILKRRFSAVLLIGVNSRSETQDGVTRYGWGNTFTLVGLVEHEVDIMRHDLLHCHFDNLREDDEEEPK